MQLPKYYIVKRVSYGVRFIWAHVVILVLEDLSLLCPFNQEQDFEQNEGNKLTLMCN